MAQRIHALGAATAAILLIISAGALAVHKQSAADLHGASAPSLIEPTPEPVTPLAPAPAAFNQEDTPLHA